jgi:hypothetical protein
MRHDRKFAGFNLYSMGIAGMYAELLCRVEHRWAAAPCDRIWRWRLQSLDPGLLRKTYASSVGL